MRLPSSRQLCTCSRRSSTHSHSDNAVRPLSTDPVLQAPSPNANVYPKKTFTGRWLLKIKNKVKNERTSTCSPWYFCMSRIIASYWPACLYIAIALFASNTTLLELILNVKATEYFFKIRSSLTNSVGVNKKLKYHVKSGFVKTLNDWLFELAEQC